MGVAALFGWPGVALAFAAAAVGLATRSCGWIFAGAILALPFTLYLAANPNGPAVASGILGSLAATAAAARANRFDWAAFSWAFGLALCLGIAVFLQVARAS